jgi:hypothetical protein
MPEVGRPNKNGYQPIWMCERSVLALYAYDDSRKKGAKHIVAIQEAVDYVRRTRPGMPISETEVKRVIARWRATHLEKVVLVTKPNPETSIRILPNGRVVRPLFRTHFGPRPYYPRANAVSEGKRIPL